MNERERERDWVMRNGLEMSDQGDGDGELRSSRTPPPRSFLTTVKNDQAVCVDEADYVAVMELLWQWEEWRAVNPSHQEDHRRRRITE